MILYCSSGRIQVAHEMIRRGNSRTKGRSIDRKCSAPRQQSKKLDVALHCPRVFGLVYPSLELSYFTLLYGGSIAEPHGATNKKLAARRSTWLA